MTIKTIVIEGIDQDISIRRTERGAEVTIEQHTRRAGKQDICIEVAKLVYGTDRRGRAAATNSMVHDVLNEMERVAGC
jgi:hypothetical protein